MNLVFLPATADDDFSYGRIPAGLCIDAVATIRQVRFPSMVWYNPSVCQSAIAQIRAWPAEPIVLVGFSKSALGAWNIARRIPEVVVATILFDAPVAHLHLPPWGTDPFYADDPAWQRDLPLLTIPQFKIALPAEHQLVLVSGSSFHAEMEAFSQALCAAAVNHTFLPRPTMKHHWNAGWIEEAIGQLTIR